MATAVEWQVRSGSLWEPLNAWSSAALETAFTTSSASVSRVTLQITLKSYPYLQTEDFDVTAMTWTNTRSRRTKSVDHAARLLSIEFYDGQAWIAYDDYLHALVIDALNSRRSQVGVHIGDHHLVIHFPNGSTGDMYQVSSNRVIRPVRTKSAVIQISTSPLTVPVVDDETLPDDLRCPITQFPMQDPVTAADGHVYERAAIECWIYKQSVPKSPVTNLVLASSILYPAHFVRNVLQSYQSLLPVAAAAVPSSTPTKRAAGSMVASSKKMHCPKKRTTCCSYCACEIDQSSMIVPCRICGSAVICVECDMEEVFVCNGCQGT